MPDTPNLEQWRAVLAAHDRHTRARQAVTDWMDAEGREGRLRFNDQAPGWSEYNAALSAFAEAQSFVGGNLAALLDYVERLETALRTHGRHDPLCNIIYDSENPCSCGLRAALTSTSAPTTGETT